MKNELSAQVKFDTASLVAQVESHETLKNKVSSNVKVLLEKLPKDLTTLALNAGDKAEEQVQGVINKIKDAANDNQSKRMEYTRKFDDIKKQFTTAEAAIKEELKKLEDFVVNWNSEKLKRQREEDEKLKKVQQEKQRIAELKSDIKTYYLTLIIKYHNEQIAALEGSFYAKEAEELKEWGEKFKNWNTAPLRKKWMDMFNRNPYPNMLQGEMKALEDSIFKEEIVRCIDEKLDLMADKIKELVVFIPSRLEQLKDLDQKAKDAEAEKLKERQANDLKEQGEKLKQDSENELLEERTAIVVESIDAGPSTELSKGASVKLKYIPVNKTQLLKIINWYLQNEYVNDDFETIQKRLSFMMTAADRSLNANGEVIDGVPTDEVVSKRRTK